MAIEKRKVTLYRVRCGICGDQAPESEDLEQALVWAEYYGLKLYYRMDGQRLISQALCEFCQEIQERDGKHGDMESVHARELARLIRSKTSKQGEQAR